MPEELSEKEREEFRTEQRRMWCVQQAMAVAMHAHSVAPTLPTIDIMKTAEEMVEFIENGVARTHDAPRRSQ